MLITVNTMLTCTVCVTCQHSIAAISHFQPPLFLLCCYHVGMCNRLTLFGQRIVYVEKFLIVFQHFLCHLKSIGGVIKHHEIGTDA